jgi:hypothetical protein
MKLIVACVALLFLNSCQQIYFALTNIIATPTAMQFSAPITQPSNDQKHFLTDDKKNTVTFLIYGNDNIYGYIGVNISSGQKYSYGKSINTFLKKIKSDFGQHLFVQIKPSATASYKNTVDILDEMIINMIKKYEMTEPSLSEQNFINSLK